MPRGDELLCNLECKGPASTVAGNSVGAVSAIPAYLLDFIACQSLDGVQRFGAVEPWWLYADNRLRRIQVARQWQKTKDIASMTGYGENRRPASLWLNRNNGYWSALQRLRLAQKSDYLVLTALQRFAQC
jgi:hypothetical protein